jgi:hypothetical protein
MPLPGVSASLAALTLNDVAQITLKGITVTGTISMEGVVGVDLDDSSVADITVKGSHDTTVSGDHISTDNQSDSGINVSDGSYAISIENNVIRGGLRGIFLYGGVQDEGGWVHDVDIRGNDVGGPAEDDVNMAGARSVLVEGNIFRAPAVTDGHDDGVQSEGSDGLSIVGNRFEASGRSIGPDQGIILGDADPPNEFWKVTNTLVENNVIQWRGTGIAMAGTRMTRIINNTSVGDATNGQPAVSLFFDTKGRSYLHDVDAEVWNNVFDSIEERDPKDEPSYEDYNCVMRGGIGDHDVTADPQVQANFQLAPGSPCLGAGRTDGAPPTDINGRTRTAPPDMGAFQH